MGMGNRICWNNRCHLVVLTRYGFGWWRPNRGENVISLFSANRFSFSGEWTNALILSQHGSEFFKFIQRVINEFLWKFLLMNIWKYLNIQGLAFCWIFWQIGREVWDMNGKTFISTVPSFVFIRFSCWQFWENIFSIMFLYETNPIEDFGENLPEKNSIKSEMNRQQNLGKETSLVFKPCYSRKVWLGKKRRERQMNKLRWEWTNFSNLIRGKFRFVAKCSCCK